MRFPSYTFLKELKSESRKVASFAQGVHPNPRFYKYQWWVFWAGSPVEGREFLEMQYALSTSALVDLLRKLNNLDEASILYNVQVPRHELGVTPFEPVATKWSNCRFAPAWNEDSDPVVVDRESVLLGHR